MADKEPPPSTTSSSMSAFSVASPASSEVSGLMEKEITNPSIASSSPAPSNCSIFSEQEQIDNGSISRQSPFHLASQPSPSHGFPNLPMARPDYLNGLDSETSSRSSLDGIQPATRHQYRTRKRKNSSDSSGSEESVVTLGGNDMENDLEPISRKNSKNSKLGDDHTIVIPGRVADAPRGRIANIRRESNCSIDSEAAHERMVKATQVISNGFDDILSLEKSKFKDPRKRVMANASTIGDPISINTNTLLPNSCSPSPTRPFENQKQYYSPSAQQVVKITPSSSPTQSPTRNRLLSLSPSATKQQALKRRYTTGNGDDIIDPKRSYIRASTSPLVTERSFPYPSTAPPPPSQEFVQPQLFPQGPGSLTRRFGPLDPDQQHFSRRTSIDSSDDQKSVKDDISEPNSVQQPDPGDTMDVEESSITSSKPEEPSSTSSLSEEKKDEMMAMEEEAMTVPLPEDDDDDL